MIGPDTWRAPPILLSAILLLANGLARAQLHCVYLILRLFFPSPTEDLLPLLLKMMGLTPRSNIVNCYPRAATLPFLLCIIQEISLSSTMKEGTTIKTELPSALVIAN